MSEDYLLGTDVLGADLDAVGAVSAALGPFVTIHVRNIPELVKKEGGAAGAFAQGFLPKTIESTVYSKMAQEISSGMKAKGVDAEVKVVATAPAIEPLKRDFIVGGAIGAGAVGVGWLIKQLFWR